MQEIRQLFQEMLQQVPVSLAAREMTRLVALRKRLPEEATVLDVGCGDGSFWKVYPGVQKLQLDGLDLSCDEVLLARSLGIYRKLEVGDISLKPPEQTYQYILGNCSLEHVPNIHKALTNIRLGLEPEGSLILMVPSFGWSKALRIVRALGVLSPRLEMAASGALDGFFQHHHIYDETSWVSLVENAGYRVTSVQGLGAPQINRVFEDQLPLGFFEFLYKSMRRRYPNWRFLRRMPAAAFFEALAAQPVPLGSPGMIEYMIEATSA